MEGKEDEAFVIDQLSSMLPEYRLILSQIFVSLSEAKRAHLRFGVVEEAHEDEVLAFLDTLSIGFTAVTTAGQDFAPFGTRLNELIQQYKDHIIEFQQIAEEFQRRLGEMKRAQEQVIVVSGGIDEQIVQTTEHIQEEVVGIIRSSNRAVVGLSVIVAAVMIGAVLYVVKVIQPIKHLAHTADQLSEGNIACDTYGIKSSDEIGTLSGAFDKLITYLAEMASAATEISQGDLSRNIRPRSKHDVLGHAFLNMSAYLNEMAEEAIAIAVGDLRRNVQPKSPRDSLGNAFQQMKELRQSISEIMDGAKLPKNSIESVQKWLLLLNKPLDRPSLFPQILNKSARMWMPWQLP
jgi:HAMP domain-containing protein